MTFPHIPTELIKALEAAFPERSPYPTESFQELMVQAGRAAVVRFLRSEYDHQNDNILKRPVHVQAQNPQD
jgi:hypothetical protein